MRTHVLLVPLLAACAPPPASREPARYPPLRAQASGSTIAAAFVPGAELVPVALSCSPEEPAIENALDDDCDGRIDGVESPSTLVVALAYPRAAALKFYLRAGEEAPQPIPLQPCTEPAPFCAIRLDTSSLPHGQYSLWVEGTDQGASSLPSSVLVSASSEGKLGTYLLRLEQAQPARKLGQLANP